MASRPSHRGVEATRAGWPRRLTVANAAGFVVASAVAVAISEQEDWEPIELVLIVFGFSAASVLAPVQLGQHARVTAGEMPPIVLAIALLGPAPAVAVGLFGTAIDAVRRRPGIARTIGNLMSFAAFPLIGALAFELAMDTFGLDRAGLGFAALVVALYSLENALSFGIAAAQWRFGYGARFRDSYHEVFVPVLGLETIAGILLGFIAYAYGEIGTGAIVAAVPFALVADRLLRELIRSRVRAQRIERLAEGRRLLVTQTLDAEDRARRNLAQILHDDAIQRLLSARHDLENALAGDWDALRHADELVSSTVERLRRLSFDLHPAVLRHAGLEAAIRAVAQHQAERAGFEVTFDLAAEVDAEREPLILSLAQELLTNAAKHAQSAHVAVRLTNAANGVELEVRDDGNGFEPAARSAAVMAGHIGLASVAERVEAIGGAFTLTAAPGEGTRATLRIPGAQHGSGTEDPSSSR